MINIALLFQKNDIPRGFRSTRRASLVRRQRVDALEQIQKSQRNLYAEEKKALENESPNDIWPMTNLEADIPSSNNYKVVDKLWNEEDTVYSNPKVIILIKSYPGNFTISHSLNDSKGRHCQRRYN